jgi:DNA recombination protein RmuC
MMRGASFPPRGSQSGRYSESWMVNTLLLGAVLLVLGAVLMVLYRQSRARRDGGNLAIPVQTLTTLAERLAQMEPVAPAVTAMQIELRGLVERVTSLEQGQGSVGQGLQTLHTSLQTELTQARVGLAELHTQATARVQLEQRTADSVWRLETIIAGTQSKGAAGENILDAVFAKLPVEWQERNFKVGNKTVEFALRLPNNLILPIDSKWPATHLLEQFAACDDIAEQQRLKSQIEAAVLGKAREIKKYIDPSLTVSFGVAAVPDAVYDLCSGIQGTCFVEHNAVLVAYSMFMPYLLLVVQTVQKTSQNLDLEKLEAYLRSAQDSVRAAQQEVEGRFSRSLTMLSNSRDDLSLHLSKVNSGLTSLQMGAGTPQTTVGIAASIDRHTES